MHRVSGVHHLADGESRVIEVHTARHLTVISSGVGVTANINRVDSRDATEDVSGDQNSTTVAAEAKETIVVDWPFYRITATGGPVRFALV